MNYNQPDAEIDAAAEWAANAQSILSGLTDAEVAKLAAEPGWAKRAVEAMQAIAFHGTDVSPAAYVSEDYHDGYRKGVFSCIGIVRPCLAPLTDSGAST